MGIHEGGGSGRIRKLGFALLAVAALAAVLIDQRHALAVRVFALAGTPGLAPAGDEGPGVRWHDDYFTVEALGDGIFAIGEPRYYQQNYGYLIAGTQRAVLFDAGPGYRDIRPRGLNSN